MQAGTPMWTDKPRWHAFTLSSTAELPQIVYARWSPSDAPAVPEPASLSMLGIGQFVQPEFRSIEGLHRSASSDARREMEPGAVAMGSRQLPAALQHLRLNLRTARWILSQP